MTLKVTIDLDNDDFAQRDTEAVLDYLKELSAKIARRGICADDVHWVTDANGILVLRADVTDEAADVAA